MKDEETIKKETLEYLDMLLIGIETLESPCIFEHIRALNKQVDSYKEKLKEEYSLKLKR